jgi:hypothetical protein
MIRRWPSERRAATANLDADTYKDMTLFPLLDDELVSERL